MITNRADVLGKLGVRIDLALRPLAHARESSNLYNVVGLVGVRRALGRSLVVGTRL
jgi:hypothetical protein